MIRRALAIDEASYGAEHPTVAIRLNNLAQLLQSTNRSAEAEPLIRRALAIDEASYGAEHPTVAIRLNNLAQLLQALNRLEEAAAFLGRGLLILMKFEVANGTQHPNYGATRLAYISLLRAMGNTTEEINAAIDALRKQAGLDPGDEGIPDLISTAGPPKLPSQGIGPHFELNTDGILDLAPPEALDKDGNNVARLRKIHPELRNIAGQLASALLEGNQAHSELYQHVESYRLMLEQNLEDIDFSMLYIRGLRLENAERAAMAQIEAGALNLFSPRVHEAIRTALRLHGPFMLATKEGIELISAGDRYRRTSAEEEKYLTAAVDFAAILILAFDRVICVF